MESEAGLRNFSASSGCRRQGQEDGHDVEKLVLQSLREPVHDADLSDEVSEHEAADEGAADGNSSIESTRAESGNKIFSTLPTCRNCFMRIFRSCSVSGPS
jgi:hypothetical protein